MKTFIISFLILVGLVSCRNQPTTPDDIPTSLQITSDSFAIFSGGSLQLHAIATLKDGSERDVTDEAIWSNQPGTAGKINDKGEFTAFIGEIGFEEVQAQFEVQSASATIEVTRRAKSLAILPVNLSIQSGESIQFQAIANFEDNTQKFMSDEVTWSLRPGVAAEIDHTGLFRSFAGMTGVENVVVQYQNVADSARVVIRNDLENPVEMVEIPGGSFTMGNDNGTSDQRPEHQVVIDAFNMAKYEVTNSEYVAFLNAAYARNNLFVESDLVFGKSGKFANLIYIVLQGTPDFPDEFIRFNGENDQDLDPFTVLPGFADFPVVRVTWYGAQAFCDFYGLRLPTEAEWEWASGAGQQLVYGTADGTLGHDLANYVGVGGRDIYDGLAPVGSFPANPFGLYDMCGNAAEYVFDVYDPNYYSVSPSSNPTGPGPAMPLGRLSGIACDKSGAGALVVSRGGAWLFATDACKSAYRNPVCDVPEPSTGPFYGFRAAQSLH